jgi:trk system potassium uptake protein TrkA
MIRKYYGVERIVTLVNDPENIEVFNRLGVRVAVSPAALLGQTIQNLLSAQEMEDFFPVEEGKLVFLRLEIPDNSPSVNKKLKEIDLPNECIIGGILRNNDVLIPRGETELLAQDRVFIICEPKVQTRVIKTLVGE